MLIEIGAHACFVVAVLGRLQISHQHHLVEANVTLKQQEEDRRQRSVSDCLNKKRAKQRTSTIWWLGMMKSSAMNRQPVFLGFTSFLMSSFATLPGFAVLPRDEVVWCREEVICSSLKMTIQYKCKAITKDHKRSP